MKRAATPICPRCGTVAMEFVALGRVRCRDCGWCGKRSAATQHALAPARDYRSGCVDKHPGAARVDKRTVRPPGWSPKGGL